MQFAEHYKKFNLSPYRILRTLLVERDKCGLVV